MNVIKTPGMRARESSTSYNKKGNMVVACFHYMDRSKSKGKKVGYAAVFTDTTRRGALPEEASIHTAIKEIKERKDIRWVIYTDSLSSMLAIENNRENHPILNQIYTYKAP